MDKFINRMGLGVALLAIVMELTYLNAKSLLYLTGTDTVDKVFAVVGAFAFSVVTVVVMRKRTAGIVKMIFPWFDAALMFLGLNLKYADSFARMDINPIQLGLTVFMALLAGISTYALGLINYREHESDIDNGKSEIEARESKLVALQTNFDNAQLMYESTASELDDLRRNYNNVESAHASEVASLKSKLKTQASDLEKYRRAYLIAERGRILKKKEANRTETERAILAECETL